MPHKIGNPARRRRHFIKEWREFRGLTQEQLADDLGTTKTSISRIEALKQGYTQDFLEACADALGTHAGTLLTRAPVEADRDDVMTAKQKRRAGMRVTASLVLLGISLVSAHAGDLCNAYDARGAYDLGNACRSDEFSREQATREQEQRAESERSTRQQLESIDRNFQELQSLWARQADDDRWEEQRRAQQNRELLDAIQRRR